MSTIVRGVMTTPKQNQDKVVVDMDSVIRFLSKKPSISLHLMRC